VQAMTWRREQIGTLKSIGLAFLVCIFLLCGCGGKAKAPKEIEKTTAEKEKAELLKEIERKFEDIDAHFRLGQLYQADGQWNKAEDQYSIVLNFEPAHRQAQAARVKVLTDSGNTERARLLANEYKELACVSAEGSRQLAQAFQQQGLDEYALECYQQALRLAPDSAKINKQIGYYYLNKGNNDVAREYLSRSFQLNPNQPDVAGELGRLGVPVKRPQKTVKNTKKPDKMEKSEKSPKSQ